MNVVAPEDSPSTLWLMALRELRLARVLTVRELAQQAGVSTKTITDIEKYNVRPQPGTLRKIARVLGVPVTTLADHMEPEKHRTGPQRP